MTALVTGASGHLGANLVRALLASGVRVRVLVHRSAAALAELEGELELSRGSVCDPEAVARAMQGVRRVYHLAGVISINGDAHGRVQRVNVGGTATVAAACRASAVERLVHVSSVHAFDMAPRDQPLDETRRQVAASAHHSAYDRSKAQGEEAVREAVAAGLDAVIVNPTGIIGPQDYGPSRLGQLLWDLERGKLPALLEGGFDFVDARDVAAGIIAAGERARRGHNYILGNAWCSLRALAELVEAAGGHAAPRLTTPLWAAQLGVPFARSWSRLRGSEPLFTAESLAIVASNRSISSAKARRELGYSVRPLAQTVRDSLAWMREAY